ncbi:MAG: hypothetical protein WD066_19490 [Planctomycetaceae bacterium]
MTESVFDEAGGILGAYWRKVVTRAAEDILEIGEPSDIRSQQKLDNVLEEVSRVLWNLDRVAEDLRAAQPRRRAPSTAPTPPTPPLLRVAVIHCPSGMMTETVNQWLQNHRGTEVVSLQFTNLDHGLACVVLYRI